MSSAVLITRCRTVNFFVTLQPARSRTGYLLLWESSIWDKRSPSPLGGTLKVVAAAAVDALDGVTTARSYKCSSSKKGRHGEGDCWTYKSDSVRSPRIEALSSISMSRFASSESFRPSVSLSSLCKVESVSLKDELVSRQHWHSRLASPPA